MVSVKETSSAITFAIRVHPRGKKNAITGEVGDALKVSLTARPIEGAANETCIKFFAKLLKVPRSSVTIASGLSSRNKVIRMAGVTARQPVDQLRSQTTEPHVQRLAGEGARATLSQEPL
jgi:uncharacterized protein